MFVFVSPCCIQLFKRLFCCLFVHNPIHCFNICAECLSIFPNHIFTTVAYLVYYAELRNCLREYTFNTILNPLRLSVQAIRISSTPLAFISVSTSIRKEGDSDSAIHIPGLLLSRHFLNRLPGKCIC